jgi:hypothetical protein
MSSLVLPLNTMSNDMKSTQKAPSIFLIF